MLLRSLDHESSMQVLAKSELELPGVVPGGQGFGHRFVIGAHVVDDLVDDDPQPSQRFLGRTGQPRQRGELDARGDELGVLGDQVTWKL